MDGLTALGLLPELEVLPLAQPTRPIATESAATDPRIRQAWPLARTSFSVRLQ
jgi:hypothetical protein